jgi:hypothetical protein
VSYCRIWYILGHNGEARRGQARCVGCVAIQRTCGGCGKAALRTVSTRRLLFQIMHSILVCVSCILACALRAVNCKIVNVLLPFVQRLNTHGIRSTLVKTRAVLCRCRRLGLPPVAVTAPICALSKHLYGFPTWILHKFSTFSQSYQHPVQSSLTSPDFPVAPATVPILRRRASTLIVDWLGDNAVRIRGVTAHSPMKTIDIRI